MFEPLLRPRSADPLVTTSPFPPPNAPGWRIEERVVVVGTVGSLDSWKQITRLLDKNERTVRRWEQTEGLPDSYGAIGKLDKPSKFSSALSVQRVIIGH